jgi:hypothetical protein
MRVLAVPQVGDLLEDHREPRRERCPGELVEVGGDLGVVGGDGPERLGGELGAELCRNHSELAQLGDHLGVVLGLRDGRDAGRVPGGRAEQRRPAHVDQLDCLVDPDVAPADFRGERLHVDDHEVDRADAVLGQLVELGLDVAPREDAGIDRGVERLDLPADERRDLRQVGDRRDLDALSGEVLPRAVGGIDLDVELTQLASEGGNSLSVGD